MIRNDADVVLPFLAQCLELFDRTAIIDVQSTDGTRECLARCAATHGQIELFTTTRRERFQGAMMNLLSRRAFAQGADWVFLLDADEFLSVGSRAEFEATLAGFNAGVMELPWINLVPTEYGSFASFDPTQRFYAAARSEIASKVALSQLFAANNPGYAIHEGNHFVSPVFGALPVTPCPGLDLLHVPVRSAHRLKYKVGTARRMTHSKHNRFHRECEHLDAMDVLLQDNIAQAALNDMAARYGEAITGAEPLEPQALGWPTRRLPPFIAERLATFDAPTPVDQAQTLLGEADLVWDRAPFTPGSPVAAVLDGTAVSILPQPLAGSGATRAPRFDPLGAAEDDARSPQGVLADATACSCLPIRRRVASDCNPQIPLLFALVAALRPRRFVQLGVQGGESFFAACQAVSQSQLTTECVAVDSWTTQAGSTDEPMFAGVQNYIAEHYPDQTYLRAYRDTALRCFADGSIDLLHVDGEQGYDAARHDFEAWLPKLADRGMILLNRIKVVEPDTGVWRLWQEVSRRYPAFALLHGQGLGILYVGSRPSLLADLLGRLVMDPALAMLAQTHFASLGALAASIGVPAEEPAGPSRDALQIELDLAREDARIAWERLANVHASTSWRATSALRWLLERTPAVRRILRRLIRRS